MTDQLRLSLSINREQSHGTELLAPAHRIGKTGYDRIAMLARADLQIDDESKAFGWVNWVENTMDWQDSEADSYLALSAVGYTRKLTENLELSSQLSYAKWDAETSDETNERLQPEAYLTWHATDSHTLTGGIDLKHHEFERSNAEGTPDQDTYGAFLQDQWQISETFTLMVALRYDDVEDIGSELTPKISMVFSPDMPLRLRGSIARGFHAPTPQELYEEGYGHGGAALRFGNPDLEPELSTTYSAGLELFPGYPFEVMLYGHYSEIDDMIVPVYEGAWAADPTKDVWRRTNIAHAKVYGGEVKARYTFARGVKLEAGYSYTSTEDEDSGRQLPYDPGSSAFLKGVAGGGINANWRWSGFVTLRTVFERSAWNWQPAAGAPVGSPTGMTTELEDYEKLDAGITFAYRDAYEIFLNVENILGQDVENLDDALTIIDGKPVTEIGIKFRW